MTAGTRQTRSTSALPLRRGAGRTRSVPVQQSRSVAEGRFYFGLAGLFISMTSVLLAIWAIVPEVGWSWSSVVITSGSMTPSIAPGDVIVAAPHDGRGLGPGTVVVFQDAGGHGLVTHRIAAVNEDGTYQTKGDANRVNDSTPLSPEQVVGVGKLMIPLVGLPVLWTLTGAWLSFGVWAGVMVLAVWSARFALLEKYDPWPPSPSVERIARWQHRRTASSRRKYQGRHRAGQGMSDAYA